VGAVGAGDVAVERPVIGPVRGGDFRYGGGVVY
jgi:hypothetical protein